MACVYKTFNTHRTFGVELEVSNTVSQDDLRKIVAKRNHRDVLVTSWAESITNHYWHVKTDSTCGPLGKYADAGGFEVTSFVASGYKDLMEIVKIANRLAKNGVVVNDNCGLHIHVGVSDFTVQEVGVLLGYWLKIEEWMRQMVPDRRKNNKYCKFLAVARGRKYEKDRTYSPKVFYELIKPTNLSPHDNAQRRVALNLVNYTAWNLYKKYSYTGEYRPTLEFRFPEGTLNGKDIKNWVCLFLLFVENMMHKTMPENLSPSDSLDYFLSVCGLQCEQDLLILSPCLFNLKVWILRRIIEFGGKKYAEAANKKLQFLTCN